MYLSNHKIPSCKKNISFKELCLKPPFYDDVDFRYNSNDIISVSINNRTVHKSTNIEIRAFYISEENITSGQRTTRLRGHALLGNTKITGDVIASSDLWHQILVLGPDVKIKGCIKGFDKIKILTTNDFNWEDIDPDYQSWCKVFASWFNNK